MFKMAKVHFQITQHVKNQENLNISQGIRQSRNESPEIKTDVGIINKDFKATIITMLKKVE